MGRVLSKNAYMFSKLSQSSLLVKRSFFHKSVWFSNGVSFMLLNHARSAHSTSQKSHAEEEQSKIHILVITDTFCQPAK